ILITCELSDIQHAFIIFKHQVWSSSEQALSTHGESKVVLYDRQAEKICKKQNIDTNLFKSYNSRRHIQIGGAGNEG
ncbi:hypothetical protein, partial [Desulfobacula sp.]|uniref:hypothetical protein n=1 Tax=Desulfobacula sp. TaxID=2593537 RepID=UPI0039B9ADEB